jgi:DNA-binding FadR family transcriptional regulator
MGNGLTKKNNRSAVDDVVVHLITGLLRGERVADERIATERELGESLGVSRATVRGAIGRLVEWGVLVSKQGSGTVVRPRSRWRLGALPSVLGGLIDAGEVSTVVELLRDALELRRSLVLDLLERAATRAPFDAPEPIRAAAVAAWNARDDHAAFLERDHQFLAGILDAAGMSATLWLLNDVRRTYEAVVLSLAIEARPPDSYLSSHLATLEALQRGDGLAAREAFEAFLDDLDATLVATLPDTLVTMMNAPKEEE